MVTFLERVVISIVSHFEFDGWTAVPIASESGYLFIYLYDI